MGFLGTAEKTVFFGICSSDAGWSKFAPKHPQKHPFLALFWKNQSSSPKPVFENEALF